MKVFHLRKLGLAAILLAPGVGSAQNNGPGSIERRVEPEYDAALGKSYIIDHVKVEMIVDQEGVPFSLSAEPRGVSPPAVSSLPDNVVEALSKWRFRPEKKNGQNIAFSILLTVPVRRAIGRWPERAFRQRWRAAKESMDAIKAAKELDAASATRLAQRIDADPSDANARATMLVYLAGAKGGDAGEVRKTRLQNILWLVQNHPDLDILGGPYSLINTGAGPLQDDAGYRQVRDLWLEQLAHPPSDQVVLEHATNFLRLADPERTEQALLPLLSKMDTAGEWMGNLYAFAALGVTGLDPATGLPVAALARMPETAFARKARSTLAVSTDARVVLSGMASMNVAGRSLSAAGHLPEGYAGLCQELLGHAKELVPDLSTSCDVQAAEPEVSEQPTRIRVGGTVQAANIRKKVTPEYPSGARSRGIQGTVRFLTVIDNEGRIQSLSLISGPLALYESARDAVSKWQYRPTSLNGRPIEVVTRIDVNYDLYR
ncbi:MAG TPA: energy transducer TonB [Bryobacteraceae bacterium]|nr:energy transducer TonB [Bryobacteraceae bacterium]